jgi:hypothetical protein
MWDLFKKEIKNGGHETCGPSSRMKWGVKLTDDRCTKTQKKWGKITSMNSNEDETMVRDADE